MVTEAAPPTNGCEAAIEAFLASVDMGDPSAADHLCNAWSGRSPNCHWAAPIVAALELGSYLQMAAVMERVFGYGSVQPAYYSASIGRDPKTLQINGERAFTADIDLFNAEFHSVFGLFSRCRCVVRVD
jgi:hypothetical protein